MLYHTTVFVIRSEFPPSPTSSFITPPLEISGACLSWLSPPVLLCLPPLWGRSKQVDTTSRLLITLESLKASGEVQVTRCQGWSHATLLLCLQLLPSKPTLYKSQTPIHSPSPSYLPAWLSSRLSQYRLVTSHTHIAMWAHPHCQSHNIFQPISSKKNKLLDFLCMFVRRQGSDNFEHATNGMKELLLALLWEHKHSQLQNPQLLNVKPTHSLGPCKVYYWPNSIG